MHRHLDDRGRVLLRNNLDLNATFGARDDGRGAATAVDGDGEVVLLLNRLSGGNEKLADDQSLGASLVGDHLVGEHEARGVLRVLQVGHELDEARLAAATRMHLCLDHDFLDPGVEEFLRLRHRARNGFGNGESGNGDARLGEQLTGLILVDLHGGREDSTFDFRDRAQRVSPPCTRKTGMCLAQRATSRFRADREGFEPSVQVITHTTV